MKATQRWLATAFLLCVFVATYLSLRDINLPDPSLIHETIKETEPVQEASARPVFTTVIKGYTYTLTPRAVYDISGLVVSQHRGDALLNLDHKADPGNIKDVCVVWGEAISNGAYQRMKYASGEFTCSFSWSGRLTPPFNPEKISNNHLIPADAAVAKRIRAIRIGDQVRMKGLLVDYTVTSQGREIFTRRTSLTRSDTGNGACEILYVTEIFVLRAGSHLEADAAKYAWYTSLGLLVALGGVWVARPPVL
ncbi:MAG TPA: hypothetical protein VIJ73_10055 [Methylomirabilota bacterium]